MENRSISQSAFDRHWRQLSVICLMQLFIIEMYNFLFKMIYYILHDCAYTIFFPVYVCIHNTKFILKTIKLIRWR